MGRKDTCEKEFVADNDIFADIVNGVVFSGKQILKPEDLEELDTTEVYGDVAEDEKLDVQKFRDVLKRATIMRANNCCYMIVGVENQTAIHYAMVVRAMLYDALNYTNQIVGIAKKHEADEGRKTLSDYFSGIRKGDKLIPVITIIIYWGTKKWDAPRSLHEMFSADTPKEVLDLVPDYTIPVIAPAEIEDPNIYKTDLQYVFRALAAGNRKKDLKKLFDSEPAFRSLNRRTAIIINEVTKMDIQIPDDKEEIDMCQAVKEWREELLSEGTAKGKAEGRAEGEARLAVLITAMSAGADAGNIAKVASDPVYREEMYKKYGIE